ncbi:MAG: MFS transporter [Alphaproteobacteria bacterium]
MRGTGYDWRLETPIYATAFFTGNVFPMMHVLMPLWALQLTGSPLIIGAIISCRQILPVLLSIHGGALLDRFGPRAVIMVMGIIGALCTGMFPVLPFIWAAMLLQIVTGFAETTNWIGVQSAVGTILKGQPVYAGRMTAAARTGGFFGPILAGLMWETSGPYGGFLFLTGWLACGAVAASFLPRHPKPEAQVAEDGAEGATPEKGPGVMPKTSDYRDTFRLLAASAVALVIMATFMRQTGSGVQSSFYGVWLSEELGLSGTTIGFLIGFGNLVSAASALTIGPLTRRFADYWLLLAMVGFAIIGVALTPMLEGLILLSLAIGLRGVGQGLNLPLMISIASRAVAPTLQGRVAALRISFNRLGAALFPIGMGALAEVIGLEASFYVIGLIGMCLIGGLAVWVARSKQTLQN